MACINAVSFHEDPSVESICRKVVASGFDTLELSRPPFYNKLPTAATRQTFQEWANGLGLNLYGFDCWVDVLPYDRMRETVDAFRSAVQFAADLNLGILISHDPWQRDNGDRSDSQCLTASLELFKQVADMCAEADLQLVFEPHPDTLSMQNDWCIELIDGLERDNVGILYDCCHYGVGQPQDYVESIGTLGQRIRHLHFSDGDGSTYALHLPLGEGVLQLDAIVDALRQTSYRGTICCDMYNYPLLEDGARRNIDAIRAVERRLDL